MIKRLVFTALFLTALPSLAEEEKKMLNSDPSQLSEPTAEHHMQNRNPSPEVKKTEEPALGHHMQNHTPYSEPSEAAKEIRKREMTIPN
jgi:hypothetical protein